MNPVLDASATAAWTSLDEATPVLNRVFEEIADSSACVPEPWRFEVASLLVTNVKKDRYDTASQDRYSSMLESFPTLIAPHTGANAWTPTLDLAEKCQPAVYDAADLELAARLPYPRSLSIRPFAPPPPTNTSVSSASNSPSQQ